MRTSIYVSNKAPDLRIIHFSIKDEVARKLSGGACGIEACSIISVHEVSAPSQEINHHASLRPTT
jgi:hypothetical protein